ncbi:MAG: hypothetical protein GX811_11530, partial [Lentisphaerae bacterium]|nr:hypothetical protein [Lentisphaerota bacterium]
MCRLYFATAFLFCFLFTPLFTHLNATEISYDLRSHVSEIDRKIKSNNFDEAEKLIKNVFSQFKNLNPTEKLTMDKHLLALAKGKGLWQEYVKLTKQVCNNHLTDHASKIKFMKELEDFANLGSQYYCWIKELQPEEMIRLMEREYPIALAELIKLEPQNGYWRVALAKWFISRNNVDATIAVLKDLAQLEKLSPMQRAEMMSGRIQVALMKNDMPLAIKYAKELVDSGISLPPPTRHRSNPVREARFFINMVEPDFNALDMPVYTGGNIFPVPQKVDYSNAFIPLTSVSIVLGSDIKDSDIRVRLLKSKLEYFGVKVEEGAPFKITINADNTLKAPEKPQGYALKVTRTDAIINGFDSQGTLWGIVSFIQLIDRTANPKIRMAKVEDYPITLLRGFYHAAWDHSLELSIFSKMNIICSQNGPQIYNHNPANPITPLQWAITKAQSQLYSEFGLRHYYGLFSWTMFYPVPLSSERTFDLQLDICMKIAEDGGHVYYPYDDMRFPV